MLHDWFSVFSHGYETPPVTDPRAGTILFFCSRFYERAARGAVPSASGGFGPRFVSIRRSAARTRRHGQIVDNIIIYVFFSSDGKPRPRGRPDADTQRLGEIGAYNGTVFSVQDGGAGGRRPAQRLQPATAFVYYWRVEAFWRLTFADGRARSPPFYVSPRGYRLALAVHSDAAARTVRVAAVPAAGEYDAQLRWPFAHRLRLSVLDQTDVAPEDIVSHVWDDVRCAGPAADDRDGVCAFMEFRHDVLTYRRYAAGDGLLVKLTVFL